MSTTGNTSTTLMLLAGMLSISVAAFSYYYSAIDSPKSTRDHSEQNNRKTPTFQQTSKINDKEESNASKSTTIKAVSVIKTPASAIVTPIVADTVDVEHSKKVVTASCKEDTAVNSERPEIAETSDIIENLQEGSCRLQETDKDSSESPKTVKKVKFKEQESANIEKPETKLSITEEFISSQAVAEVVGEFTQELLQDSLESIALEQEEYVQVELTQSMLLQNDEPKEVIQTVNTSENIEATVEEEHVQDSVPSTDMLKEDEIAEFQDFASPKSRNATLASWEEISSPVITATSTTANTTPLSLATQVETSNDVETLSIAVSDEMAAECKSTSSPDSSPGKRNRKRSKKAKSKKKRTKKHSKGNV